MEKEIVKLTQRKGLEKDLPILDEAEFGFSTDTQNIYIGSKIRNIPLAKEEDLSRLREQLTQLAAANKTELLNLIEGAVRDGLDGGSAYQIAIENGFVGSESEWLLSLKGERGIQGIQGIQGKDGYTPIKGIDYFDGVDGKGGKDGINGVDGRTPVKGVDYFDGLNGKDGINGLKGEKGDPFTYSDFTQEQLESLRGTRLMGQIDAPMTLTTGFHASSNGVYRTDDNGLWRTTNKIPNVGENTYKLVYTHDNAKPIVRLLYFGLNGAYITTLQTTLVNDEFIVPESIGAFAINFGVVGADPNTTPPLAPLFTSVEAIQNVKLVKKGEVTSVVTATELESRFDKFAYDYDMGVTSNDTIRVLMIGNSFSEDISQYIHDICASSGVNVIFGNLHRPGETFEGHMSQVTSNANSYTFHKRTVVDGVSNYTTSDNTSFLTGLRNENWDIVTYQQSSPLSGDYSSFNPHLPNLINFVNTNKTNPNLVHALHMTWAYPTTSKEPAFANYNSNQQTMYAAIVDAYQQAMLANDIDLLIPVGTAIQNARSIPHLQLLNNDIASDDLHLGPAGDYIGGLTMFAALIAAKNKKDLFSDVTYRPISKYHAYLSKIAVKNALINPFNITDI